MPDASSLLSQLWSSLLDLVFPPRCVGCGRRAPGSARLPGRRPTIPPPICVICVASRLAGELCPACRREPLPIDGIRRVGLHQGPLREAVHGFKYRDSATWRQSWRA